MNNIELNAQILKAQAEYEIVNKQIIDAFIDNVSTTDRFFYQSRLNALRWAIESYCKYSEQQYSHKPIIKDSDEYIYPSLFNTFLCFNTSREAKLYDTLCEFFDYEKDNQLIMSIIQLINKSAD